MHLQCTEQLLSCLSILNSFLLTLGVAGKEQKIKGKQKDETVEEKEEIPFLKFQISKLHHTFSGPFFISALIRDVNPGRTVTAYSAGHRNTLTNTPLKISFHSPQQTQARVRAHSTGTPLGSTFTHSEWHVPSSGQHIPAATRAPSRQRPKPHSTTSELPPCRYRSIAAACGGCSCATDRELRQTARSEPALSRLSTLQPLSGDNPWLRPHQPFPGEGTRQWQRKALSLGHPFLCSPLSQEAEAREQTCLDHGALLFKIKIFPFLALPILFP